MSSVQSPNPPQYVYAGQYPQMSAPQGQTAVEYGYNQPSTVGFSCGSAPVAEKAYKAAPQGQTAVEYGYNQPPAVGFSYGSVPDSEMKPVAEADQDAVMFNDRSFSNIVIRRGFIRKVYLILFAQLIITFGFVLLFSLVKPIKLFVWQNPLVYYVSYGTFFVTYFVLVCVPSVRRKYPGNLICLGIFTLVFTYMVATISSFYTTNSVIVAAGITCAVCLAITLFAIQTKIDFTMCSGLLFALLMVLIFFGFSCIIVYVTVGYSRILDCVYGGIFALLFSLFLIYDTQMIVGGKKHQLDPEEYVFGALQIYIDVVYLFLIILSLFGKSN